MKLINITIDGLDFEFICEPSSTRTGFKHTCDVFINNHQQATAACYYYNRTWERYDFQTVCIKVIDNLIDDFIDQARERYKERHGYKKLTKSRRIDFENTLENHSRYTLLHAVKKSLINNIY